MPVAGSQLSTVQASPSSTTSGVPAWQSFTASQVSVPVHTSPSSQRLSVATFEMRPVAGSQLSTVQATPSSGSTGSFEMPVAGSQLSTVQASPSSGSTGAWLTPLPASQLSTVQASPSSTSSGVPAWQSFSASQVSVPVQTSPSSQRLSVARFEMRPVPGSQLSTVQLTPSSGSTGSFEMPVAGSQLSTVQASPSSGSTGAWLTPLPASQLSTVQASPSSTSSGVPAWQSFSASQVSVPVQTSPSSQRLSVGVPGPQTPAPSQVSFSVQVTPSSHDVSVSGNVQSSAQPHVVVPLAPPSSHPSPATTKPSPQP